MQINDTMKYIAVDVETPNSKNDSICSVAYLLIDGETVVDEGYTLVDPEDVFDRFNIAIHKITPDMVVGAPKFDEVWQTLAEKGRGRVFIAHNAQFDLTVLSKALANRRLPPLNVNYLCTVQLAKCLHYNNCNIKGDLVLSHLAITMGIELTMHHNALYDTRACAGIFLRLLEMYDFDPAAFIKRFEYKKHSGSGKYHSGGGTEIIIGNKAVSSK